MRIAGRNPFREPQQGPEGSEGNGYYVEFKCTELQRSTLHEVKSWHQTTLQVTIVGRHDALLMEVSDHGSTFFLDNILCTDLFFRWVTDEALLEICLLVLLNLQVPTMERRTRRQVYSSAQCQERQTMTIHDGSVKSSRGKKLLTC